MKSLLLLLLQGTCSPLRLTHSRYILSRFSINSSINPKTTSSYSRNVQSYPAFNDRAGRPNKSEVRMSTFDEFHKKTADTLSIPTTKRHQELRFICCSWSWKRSWSWRFWKWIMRRSWSWRFWKWIMRRSWRFWKWIMRRSWRSYKLRWKWKWNSVSQLRSIRNSSVQWCRGWSFVCMFFFVFFSATYPMITTLHLCSVFIQTSLRELSERYRWCLQERYRSDFWCRESPICSWREKIQQSGCW